MTGATIRRSIFILATSLVVATEAQAQSTNCTPSHLVSALRQVEAQCGSAKIVSSYRRGATIRGTGRTSQHAFCNGTNGAIDAVFSNRACALSALRKTRYTILTYGYSNHIHIGTDGWSNGRRRGSVHVVQKHWPRVAQRQSHRSQNSSNGSNWSSEW